MVADGVPDGLDEKSTAEFGIKRARKAALNELARVANQLDISSLDQTMKTPLEQSQEARKEAAPFMLPGTPKKKNKLL
jgi:hypothetical protein